MKDPMKDPEPVSRQASIFTSIDITSQLRYQTAF